jgi:hypothetical protein
MVERVKNVDVLNFPGPPLEYSGISPPSASDLLLMEHLAQAIREIAEVFGGARPEFVRPKVAVSRCLSGLVDELVTIPAEIVHRCEV